MQCCHSQVQNVSDHFAVLSQSGKNIWITNYFPNQGKVREFVIGQGNSESGNLKINDFGSVMKIPYFFGYRTDFFFPFDNLKNLDPSYKMDLDIWDC